MFLFQNFFISKHLWIKRALKRIICQYLYSTQTVFLSINHNVYRLCRGKLHHFLSLWWRFWCRFSSWCLLDGALSHSNRGGDVSGQSEYDLAIIVLKTILSISKFEVSNHGPADEKWTRLKQSVASRWRLHLETLQNIDEDSIKIAISQVQYCMHPYLNTIFTLSIKLKDKIYNTFVK